ncbi:hypothetical protein MUK42_12324 [Musa troglodytarum]|uniref:Uncharacterized protein n=1 Tax=Musa troglodytarum TaxID=320322 RepID=A0A9E7GK17_9LILI|nr:hypothetical protein MUK42_12324 [Musa troglodytarum]
MMEARERACKIGRPFFIGRGAIAFGCVGDIEDFTTPLTSSSHHSRGGGGPPIPVAGSLHMLTAHGSELEMGDAHPTVARENDTSSCLPPPPPPQLNLEIRIMLSYSCLIHWCCSTQDPDAWIPGFHSQV